MSESSPTEWERLPNGARLYLDIVKRFLTRYGFEENYRSVDRPRGGISGVACQVVQQALASQHLELVHPVPEVDRAARSIGHDVPGSGETMVGLRRLDNLQDCISEVLERGVPGDLIETGVWRGGATIFMRAVLKAYGVTDRTVWVADSFQGLPRPSAGMKGDDAGDRHWRSSRLAVSLQMVQENFLKYDLLDDQVQFLVGWFKDTLPTAQMEHLAVLRLDGDMYDSTMVALCALYPKLSAGGFVIVDDYGAVTGCRAAVEDYRRKNEIFEPIEPIDWTGVYWKKVR